MRSTVLMSFLQKTATPLLSSATVADLSQLASAFTYSLNRSNADFDAAFAARVKEVLSSDTQPKDEELHVLTRYLYLTFLHNPPITIQTP